MTGRALITGITGQDGSYLAEFLLNRDYEVHGIVRRGSSFTTERIDHLYLDPHLSAASLHLHFADLSDASSIKQVLDEVQPTEVYNLAAQSHVGVSFQNPIYTADIGAMGVLRVLEAVRQSDPEIRFYQASSSEMFGQVVEVPQSETTPFHPRSPYGVAKVFAYWQTINYREAYDLFACNGILFNHESPRRGETFVSRKITRAATRIKLGLQDYLFLGNLDAERDWGYAGDYVRAMWLMLQQEDADDYVIATGERHSIREFCYEAFNKLDLDWESYVRIDDRYLRPSEVDVLEGDASKAARVLSWKPEVSFLELIDMMLEGDMALAAQERSLVDAGLKANEWRNGWGHV